MQYDLEKEPWDIFLMSQYLILQIENEVSSAVCLSGGSYCINRLKLTGSQIEKRAATGKPHERI